MVPEPRLTAAFLRALAHDLGNVLAGVRGALEIVASRATDGTAGEFTRTALGDLSRADALIRAAVAYGAPAPLDRRRVQLRRVLNDAVQHVQRIAETAGVPVHVRAVPDVDLIADLDQLAFALANVLQNAVEASGEGAPVQVTSTDETEAVINIRDHGEGTSADSRVFEPLFSTKSGHHGLGLSVAKLIVEAHGGSIEVYPASPGTGVRVRIPLASSARQASPGRTA